MKLEQAGSVALFHFLDADVSIRKLRAHCRNIKKGATYLSDVTPGMFELMESHFERPS